MWCCDHTLILEIIVHQIQFKNKTKFNKIFLNLNHGEDLLSQMNPTGWGYNLVQWNFLCCSPLWTWFRLGSKLD